MDLEKEINELEFKIRKGDLNQIVLLPKLYQHLGWDITRILTKILDLRQDGEKIYLINKEDEIHTHYSMLTGWIN